MRLRNDKNFCRGKIHSGNDCAVKLTQKNQWVGCQKGSTLDYILTALFKVAREETI